MASNPTFTALFLNAGPQMQCGVGQFTLRLQETLERLNPGSTAALALTRTEGSLAEIWRAVGSAQNIVCNFPIVAWKRVIAAPLLALASGTAYASYTVIAKRLLERVTGT